MCYLVLVEDRTEFCLKCFYFALGLFNFGVCFLAHTPVEVYLRVLHLLSALSCSPGKTLIAHFLLFLRFLTLSLESRLGRRGGLPLNLFWIFKHLGKVLNIGGVLHKQLKKVFESVFVGLCLCPAVTGGLGDGKQPGGLETLVGDLFFMLLVGEAMVGNEVEEDADEVAVFKCLYNCLGGHITIR